MSPSKSHLGEDGGEWIIYVHRYIMVNKITREDEFENASSEREMSSGGFALINRL